MRTSALTIPQANCATWKNKQQTAIGTKTKSRMWLHCLKINMNYINTRPGDEISSSKIFEAHRVTLSVKWEGGRIIMRMSGVSSHMIIWYKVSGSGWTIGWFAYSSESFFFLLFMSWVKGPACESLVVHLAVTKQIITCCIEPIFWSLFDQLLWKESSYWLLYNSLWHHKPILSIMSNTQRWEVTTYKYFASVSKWNFRYMYCISFSDDFSLLLPTSVHKYMFFVFLTIGKQHACYFCI